MRFYYLMSVWLGIVRRWRAGAGIVGRAASGRGNRDFSPGVHGDRGLAPGLKRSTWEPLSREEIWRHLADGNLQRHDEGRLYTLHKVEFAYWPDIISRPKHQP